MLWSWNETDVKLGRMVHSTRYINYGISNKTYK